MNFILSAALIAAAYGKLPDVAAAKADLDLDIEYPRMGLIRVDAFDRLLVEIRARMD